jgi:hypothetical protein
MNMLAIQTISAMLIISFTLQGCVNNREIVTSTTSKKNIQVSNGPVDFGWKLSGDRSVAPLQVFSDAEHVWLQWHPHQVLPAIFGISDHGEQLVSYEREGVYTKVEGHWSALMFRGAHLKAKARRITMPTQAALSQTVPAPREPEKISVKSLSSPAQPIYSVTRADKNLRQALNRWSGLSGWHFQAEHWTVNVDVPLSGSASFTDDFVASVRALIEATELSDRPLQPCFYSNQVLRVVQINESCDRTAVEVAS